jgi:hypothetical protein
VSIASSRERGEEEGRRLSRFCSIYSAAKLRPPPYRSVWKTGVFGLRIPHINHAPKQDFDQRGF